MLIDLGESSDDVEDEHHGSPYMAARGRAPKLFLLPNSRMLCVINLKLCVLISLGERVDGIEDEHQGALYRGNNEPCLSSQVVLSSTFVYYRLNKRKSRERCLDRGQPTFSSSFSLSTCN